MNRTTFQTGKKVVRDLSRRCIKKHVNLEMKNPRFHLLLHSAGLLEDHLRNYLAQFGLHPRQALVIDRLAKMETASQVDLARTLDVSAASMSTMTARLIEGGYISRMPNPAAVRRNQLRLTRKGMDLLADIEGAWDETDGLVRETLGDKKAETLFALALELRNGLGGGAPRVEG